MRALIVAFPNSIHTARGAELASRAGWDVHVFPSRPLGPTPELHDATAYVDPGVEVSGRTDSSVRIVRLESGRGALGGLRWDERVDALTRTIEVTRPDLVHSMEIQSGGYLTLEAKRRLGDAMPPWIVHNWGSDIYHYGRIPRHVQRIRAVLSSCDWYWAECHRDIGLARAFGLRGRPLPVVPATGGYDLDHAADLRAPGATSARGTIAVKAADEFVYLPHRALDAIEQCGDLLRGRRLALYMASPELRERAERLCERSGAEVEVVSEVDRLAPQEEILAMHGRARVSIALSASDAACTSFLDAMVMGSFPIQSNTSCAREWARHGEGVWLTDPEDVDAVAGGIRRALTDDALVDAAADANRAAAAAHLDRRIVRARWVDAYERVVAEPTRAAAA
jgi:hypothetical protein